MWKAVNYMLQFTFCHINKQSCSSWWGPVHAQPCQLSHWSPGQGCAAAASPRALHLDGASWDTADVTWSSHFALTLEKAPEQNQQQLSSSHITTLHLWATRVGLSHLCSWLGTFASPFCSCCLISTHDKYASQAREFSFLLVCRREITSLMHQNYTYGSHIPRQHFLCYSGRWKFSPSSGCFSRC